MGTRGSITSNSSSRMVHFIMAINGIDTAEEYDASHEYYPVYAIYDNSATSYMKVKFGNNYVKFMNSSIEYLYNKYETICAIGY